MNWKKYHCGNLKESKSGNTYAWFFALLPATRHIHLFAEDSYELWIDGQFMGYGPSRSAIPILYVDDYALPPADWHRMMVLVHSRNSEPILWLGFDTSIIIDCRSIPSRMYDISSPDTNVGDVGHLEYVDLHFDEYAAYTDAGCTETSAWPTAYVEPVAEEEVLYLVPRLIPPFKERQRHPMSSSKDASTGFTRIDFGEMVYGRLELKGRGTGQAPLWIDYIEHHEMGWTHPFHRREMYSDCLRNCPQDGFVWKSFHKRGFRTILLRGSIADDVEAVVHEYSYPHDIYNGQGYFECSVADFNRLWTIGKSTLDICLDDIYLDCPHRDQAQWMDAFITSRIALACYGITDLTEKCILQHLVCSFKDGKMLSPSIAGWCFMADYAMIAISYALWYVQVTGNIAFIKQIWSPCLQCLDSMKAFEDPTDGLLRNVSDAYLDNAIELCRRDKSAAMNALYISAWKAMEKLARLAGRLDEADGFQLKIHRLSQEFHRTFDVPDATNGILIDSTFPKPESFWNFNFFCEFGIDCQAASVKVTYHFSCEKKATVNFCFGSCGPARIFCNGSLVAVEKRNADWSRPLSAYDATCVQLAFIEGDNAIEFIIDNNFLNWDFYFRSDTIADWGQAALTPLDGAGTPLTAPVYRSARYWEPPWLSQTTHAYAAFADLIPASALKACLCETYYRNYISIRVPLFCTETSDAAALHNWVMPANTPWTMFFFIQGLFKAGLFEEGVAMISRAWHVMLDRNATNTWEEWNCNSSLCHAWGASFMVFLDHDILGVHPEEIHDGKLPVHPRLPLSWSFARGHVLVAREQWVDVSLERTADGTVITTIDNHTDYALEKTNCPI